MSTSEWISLGLVALSTIGTGFAVLISALVSVLYAVARMRDRETQDKLSSLAGHAATHSGAIVQLQEQVKPIASLDDKLDKLGLAVAELAARIGALPKRRG